MKKSLQPGPVFWYLGLGSSLFGFALIIANDTPRPEMTLLGGLYTMFISRIERVDERTRIVKASSTSIALLAAYVIRLVIAALYGYELIPFQLTEINYFLILVFVLAIVIYYFRLYFSIGRVGKN